jgi:hypothetical protein
LSVPAPIADAPQAVAAADASSEVVPQQRSKHKVRKRRNSSSSAAESDTPSWEHGTSSSSRSSRYDRRTMGWMLGGGVALFALIVGGVVVMLRGGDKAGEEPLPPPQVTTTPPAATVDESGDEPLPAIMRRGQAALLAETEPLARKFLDATSIDELLPWVRQPLRAKPRMQREYPQGRVEPPGLAKFNSNGNVDFGEAGALVEIRTRNFASRQLAFVETPAGLKIDWESWAGWSDMTWPALLAARPTQAQVFRVIVKRVDYYNFGFSDDKQWQSYRLESLGGEHMIYGYVKRGSTMESKIQVAPDVERAPMILKIRFPADAAASSNQVLIDEIIGDGWVERDE